MCNTKTCASCLYLPHEVATCSCESGYNVCMDLTPLKASYDADGFTVIRGFLEADELTVLQQNLDRYIRDVVPGLSDRVAFYQDRTRPETLKQMQRLERDEFFAGYLKHPLWMAVAEALLGEPAYAATGARAATGAEWFNKPAGTQHVTPPHQDNYYFCLKPPQVLTMWLALDTVDEENGCLRYVRGSHTQGARPHGPTSTLGFSQAVTEYGATERAREVAVPAQPGDVLVHHGNTIHRADVNSSATRHRRSFGMVYYGQSSRRDEIAFERYMKSLKTQHRDQGLLSDS